MHGRKADAASEDATSERGQNKATARILTVLSAFASDADCYGVTELSKLLGMSKNMIYRALTTLVEQGYLVREPAEQRYQLGFGVLELHNRETLEPDLRALCAPCIARFQELTGETVSLMVRALDYAVMIDGIETRRPGTYRMVVGALRPLHLPASGQVMLAFESDAAIEQYIARHLSPSVAPDGNGPDARELRQRIRDVRERGYAQAVRAGTLPMLSVAFPILDCDDRLHGVISTGGPVKRFGPDLPHVLPGLRAAVDDLCHRTRLYAADAHQWEIE